MVNRTLYVATFRGTYAGDATSCEVRWRSIIKMGQAANVSSRGPCYLDRKIFRGTSGGRVIALDAKTGKVLWPKQIGRSQSERIVGRCPNRVVGQDIHRHRHQRFGNPWSAVCG